jgi:prepilin-type N-terminal cleavage/methylation domain-containing protein
MDINRIRIQQGFTLIELIMVIIITSVLGVYVFSSLPVPSINLVTAATQLSDDIRYTQSLSMTKNQHYRLVKLSTTTYQILNGAGTPILLAQSTTATLANGVTFGTWANLTNNLIAFNGRGIPYVDAAATTTPLASTATINLAATGGTITVLISPQTGRVLVQ